MGCAGCDGCVADQSRDTTAFYEFHITAHHEDTERFRSWCISHGVECLEVVNLWPGGERSTDVMTRVKYVGLYPVTEATSMAAEMARAGVRTVRTKVETAPWHPEAGSSAGYWEAHLKFGHIDHDTALRAGLAVSWNAKSEYGQEVLATLRLDGPMTEGEFRAALLVVLADVGSYGYFAAKTRVEFTLYDSNRSHDDAWLGLIH